MSGVDTSVDLGGIRLRNPVLTASGTFGYGTEFEPFLDLRRIGRGHIPTLAGFREADVNEWNAFFMRGRKLFPAPQVYHELEGCYDMLVEALETVPEAMFQQGSMVTNFLAISVQHYRDHGGHIREWREREGA